MTSVVLAATGVAQEPELIAHGRECGFTVVRRCVDAVDLLAVVSMEHVDAVVLSSGLPRLSPDVIERVRTSGCRVVGLIGIDDDEARLGRMGVSVLVRVHADADGTARALAVAFAQDASEQSHVRSTRPEPSAPEGRAGSIIAVWGPAGAPGRTTIAIGLADALARGGRRTCVVDADTYAPSVALDLGLIDDISGLVVACRHADNGALDAERLLTCTAEVRGSMHALTGIGRAERWAEARPGALERVWSACRAAFDVTVIDIGSCIEPDSDAALGRRRNGAALTALAVADQVLAVADAGDRGAARLLQAWPGLPAGAGLVVRNRVTGRRGAGAWEAAVRAGGVRAPIADLPEDGRALTAAWGRGRTVAEAAPRSRLGRALGEMAEQAVTPWILAGN